MLSEAGDGARPIANQGPGAHDRGRSRLRARPAWMNAMSRARPSRFVPKDGGSLGTWLVSDALGAPQTFSCGGRTWMIDAAPGALLQTLQRHAAKVHPRTLSRHRNPEEFFQPRHTDRPRALGEPRRLNLHEPSAALPRRDLLSGGISEGRFGDDSASRAQPEFHRALCRVRDRCCVGLLVQFGYHLVGFSRQRRNGTGMKRFLPWIIFCGRCRVDRGDWLAAQDCAGRFDLAKFGKIPVLVGGRVKPLDTVARNSLSSFTANRNAPRRRQTR